MADYFQNGIITTLHRMNDRPLADMEQELVVFGRKRPMGLVLPCLFSEIGTPALDTIMEELKQVPYLDEIIIGIDRADEQEFKQAREFFGQLPQRHRLLWNDGPRLQALDALLKEHDLEPKEYGKGRNVWYCLGYVLAGNRLTGVALHDCDIVTYKRDLLARLIYPVANPKMNYAFCKGYYARYTESDLGGRVSRLLVTPLIRALKRIVGQDEYLDYLDSYRYPLAGEFSLHTDVILDMRIPSDWGLEIGVLSEVNRNFSTKRLCQVDIADRYDHKHQDLSAGDFDNGLAKMSTDIAKAIFRKLATSGHVLTPSMIRAVKATYYRIALDFIKTYYHDAIINGLDVDRHKEEENIEVFVESIMRAGDYFLENPLETPFISSWSRVRSALPDVFERFYDAVEQDNS